MSEAVGGGRAEVERRLIQRSLQDESFRQRLFANPRAAMDQELGTPLPEGIEIRAVEETADTIYLMLPGASSAQGSGLSDEELATVAGGDIWANTIGGAGVTCGVGCTPTIGSC